MQLFVRAQTLLTLQVSESETLAQVKEKVAELSGVPPQDQVLLWAGSPLDDGTVLGQSPLPELATLELSTRLLGGKVHGSLARAGKVRGQTPKVRPSLTPRGFGDPPGIPLLSRCPLGFIPVPTSVPQ
ncbi:ubiquitin-like protein FUBI [Empidonax traillii]|uniref:ubiquitin-like protein FUBI n=1 Tax=Empidonax traillii TaxID=164674 RepID=UPI000FFDA9B2|nr:ubiquitin-like protein FUBI [Empidonax traillii]